MRIPLAPSTTSCWCSKEKNPFKYKWKILHWHWLWSWQPSGRPHHLSEQNLWHPHKNQIPPTPCTPKAAQTQTLHTYIPHKLAISTGTPYFYHDSVFLIETVQMVVPYSRSNSDQWLWIVTKTRQELTTKFINRTSQWVPFPYHHYILAWCNV